MNKLFLILFFPTICFSAPITIYIYNGDSLVKTQLGVLEYFSYNLEGGLVVQMQQDSVFSSSFEGVTAWESSYL